ncbi:MAG: YegS/Rv2252/BmrU family lipid kinase [Clostridia bacterium]|nr:YegS/Rv2252/BmrU family lipid kinase [Clostridia bacterium]
MLDFIMNLNASGRKAKKLKFVLSSLKKRLNEKSVKYKFHCTRYPRHAVVLTEQLIKNGATDIIVVGGDGTLHEVINGFCDFDKANLGLIPCGTGNDFANALRLPKDPIKALDLILDNEPTYTDFMQMPTVRGINIIGMGIDVDVLKRYAALKKKTKFGYTRCLIKTLFKFDCTSFDAVIDGKTKSCNSLIACIANGVSYGGGLPICPVADPTDGKLDFITIDDVKGLKIIGAFAKLKKGKILSLKQASHTTTSDVIKIIPKTENYIVQVDGELYENIPFEVKIVSNTLKMYR